MEISIWNPEYLESIPFTKAIHDTNLVSSIYRVEISSHFFFCWDCIRKVHGLKFHVVCSDLIQNNYWLLWKRWKSNCFLCCFASQHILNVFCEEKNQRETLIIFLGCLFFSLNCELIEKTLEYQSKSSSVKKDSTSLLFFFLCDWRKRTSEK